MDNSSTSNSYSKHSNKAKEQELVKGLQARSSSDTVKIMAQLVRLRLERYKENLVDNPEETIRGRALELRELEKILVDS